MSEERIEQSWYGVRCVYRWESWEGAPYEERITLWRAGSLGEAIALAEEEAAAYAGGNGLVPLGLAQAYAIPADRIASGAEVFSLLRDSELGPEQYLDAFFDTGREHQGGE
ncbi:hypothetical protein [Streptacidiphilus anmyonensis]|uniref:hypothetical protein n=1 Tax=Streptacidiphilus anmyonensis TaxID=405782 RepID=UPI0005A8C11B|nr:hypothetical protein [Streptacidiphilus anmyonensis]